MMKKDFSLGQDWVSKVTEECSPEVSVIGADVGQIPDACVCGARTNLVPCVACKQIVCPNCRWGTGDLSDGYEHISCPNIQVVSPNKNGFLAWFYKWFHK
jgi:hypothetical protein